MNHLSTSLAIVLAAPLGLAACGGDRPDLRADYPTPIGYTVPTEPKVAAGPPPASILIPAGEGPNGAPNGWSEDTYAEQQQQADANGDMGGGYAEGIGNGQPQEDGYEDTDPSAMTDFRGALEPYGEWNEDPNYGQVWVPSQDVVGQDFAPYVSGGHWGYGDDYTWVSDYDWGWAPFHYGRWVYGGYGWSWIPGRTYSGAWVTWRTGATGFGYVGWAPLPPTYGWRNGASFALGFHPTAPYVFTSTGNLFGTRLGPNLLAGREAVVQVAAQTRPIPMRAGMHGAVPRGPTPASLNISAHMVLPVPSHDRGILQARAYSRPSGAAMMGARGPALPSSRVYQPVAHGAWGGDYGHPTSRSYGPASRSNGTHYFPGAGSNAYSGHAAGAYGGGYGAHAAMSNYHYAMPYSGNAPASSARGRATSRGSAPSDGDAPVAHGEGHGDYGGGEHVGGGAHMSRGGGGGGRGGGGRR